MVEIIATAIAGGFIGWLVLAAFDPRGQAADLDMISMVGGALVAVGINRFLRG